MGVTELRRGSIGRDVKKLQLLLNSTLKPPPHIAVDGSFGAGTLEAVIRFQRAQQLLPDGVVGVRTWGALGQRGTPLLPETVLMCHADVPWLELAALELGVHEDARLGKHAFRIVEYHSTTTLKASTDEIPWCSSFVNWAITQSRYGGTNSALAKSWLQWGQRLITPRVGAVTVIRRKRSGADAATGSTTGYHVGFYISSSSTHVRLLGGNQADSVKYSNFALSGYTIEGYRWPT